MTHFPTTRLSRRTRDGEEGGWGRRWDGGMGGIEDEEGGGEMTEEDGGGEGGRGSRL